MLIMIPALVSGQIPADIRGETVIRDHIDQQSTVHETTYALDQETLFMAGFAAVFVQYGQVGRIQEQQVKGLMADGAVKEAAEADTVKPRLCVLGPAFVQLHAVGVAVVSLGELPERLAAAAAGIQQIGGHAVGKGDPFEHQVNVGGIGGIVAQLDLVHKPPDHLRVYGVPGGDAQSKALQHIVDALVVGAHEVKPGKPLTELPGETGKLILFHLH